MKLDSKKIIYKEVHWTELSQDRICWHVLQRQQWATENSWLVEYISNAQVNHTKQFVIVGFNYNCSITVLEETIWEIWV